MDYKLRRKLQPEETYS